jgi:tRNA A-37 threonylcarbamoyl transferase component Bud32
MTATPSLIADRYRLLRPLAQGGMGRIWLAEDEVLHREVAVKEVVAQDGLTSEDLQEIRPRTVREARAAARLTHPNVVRVFDIVVTERAPWIVMEYLPSRSLAETVAQDGPLTPARAAQVGVAVLAALTAAHRVGVVHRDVKPGNVLIANDGGRIVLTDFGLATIVGDPAVTRSGVVIGSPSFMAPERAADREAGPEADLWSLGATLFYAVEGRSPYGRQSTLATLAALATEDPPTPRHAGPLRPVIDGLLRRDPSARPDAATVAGMLRAIAAAPTRVPPAPRKPADAADVPPPPARPPRTRPGWLRRPDLRPLWASLRWLRPSRRVLVAVVLAAVVAAAGLWAADTVLERMADRSRGGSAAPTPAVSEDPKGTAPAPTTPAATPTPPPTGPAGEPHDDSVELPAGWHVYTDRTGVSVAVPESWPVTREGTMVYFREPGGGRVLGIDQTDQPKSDPVADWRGQEEFRVARGDFPGYRRIRLAAVDYFREAADWEFTYLQGGVRVHVNNRGLVTSPRQAYGMWWSTPDSQWERYLPDLRLIQRSFQPAE